MLKSLKIILVILLNSQVAFSATKEIPMNNIDQILLDSRTAFYKDDFDSSIQLLEKYFKKLKTLPNRKARSLFRFYSIASVGNIYLQQKQDPKGAIEWFQKIQKENLLNEAEAGVIDSWIAGVQDWMKLGKLPKDIQDPSALFELGEKYYNAGLKKQKYFMDIAASTDFSIAASYLVPFIVHFDKNPKIGEALFMVGDMRSRSWNDNKNWSHNYYLTEAIRRFPNSKTAVKAYKVLEDDVHFGFSGSSGDHTPSSWVDLLAQLKKLAEGTTDALPKKSLN